MADISIYPKEAMQAVVNALQKAGITNPNVHASVLSIIAKETGFKLKPEISYSKTANARIRTIFSKLAPLSDAELDTLKSNDVAFFDAVYGGKYGNTQKGDGHKYRGRGFNQITFKANYEWIGKIIGVDLVNNPDSLNKVTVAAAAAAAFFVRSFKENPNSLKSIIGSSNVNDIKDTSTAVKVAIRANAGWKTDFNNAIVQEGYKKAMESVNDFKNSLTKFVSDNKGNLGAALVFFLLQQ